MDTNSGGPPRPPKADPPGVPSPSDLTGHLKTSSSSTPSASNTRPGLTGQLKASSSSTPSASNTRPGLTGQLRNSPLPPLGAPSGSTSHQETPNPLVLNDDDTDMTDAGNSLKRPAEFSLPVGRSKRAALLQSANQFRPLAKFRGASSTTASSSAAVAAQEPATNVQPQEPAQRPPPPPPVAPTLAKQNSELERIADMHTVPDDIGETPVILRLANSPFAVGQGSKQHAIELRSSAYMSIKFEYGRDTLDAGISIKINYTRGFRSLNIESMTDTQKKTYKRNVAQGRQQRVPTDSHKFKARTGVLVEQNQWQLTNLQARPAPRQDLTTPELACTLKGRPLSLTTNFGGANSVAIMFTMTSAMLKTGLRTEESWDNYLEAMEASRVDKNEVDLMRALFKSPSIKIIAYFDAPKPAREWIATDFKRFQDLVRIHLPPLSPYCFAANGDENDWRMVPMGLDFPNAQRFNYGILIKAPLAQRAAIKEAVAKGWSLSTIRGYKDAGITQLPFKTDFPTALAAQICMTIEPLRDHQNAEAELMPLIDASAQVVAVKAPVLAHLPTRTFYFVVRLEYEDGLSLPMPEVDTMMQITANGGRLNGRQFFGRVKALEEEELSLLDALDESKKFVNIMISVGLQHSSIPADLNAADGFDSITYRNFFNASINPIIDDTSAQREMAAITACTTNDDDGAINNVSAYLAAEMTEGKPMNLAAGPLRTAYVDGDVTTQKLTPIGEENESMYNSYLELITEKAGFQFGQQQEALLRKAKEIKDRRFLVIGCPGGGKTTTLSWQVLGLRLVDHKILVCARINRNLDHFAVVQDGTIKTFIGIVEDSLKDADPALKIQYTKLLTKARSLKGLRWIPPAQEAKLLKHVDEANQNISILETDHLEEADDDILLAMIESTTADLAQAEAAETEKDFDEYNSRYMKGTKQVNHRRALYNRALMMQRRFEFPAAFSMQDYIQRAKKELEENPDLDSGIHVALLVWRNRQLKWAAVDSNTSKEDRKKISQDLKDAQEELFAAVIRECDLVLCTCINAQHSIMFDNFHPTGCIMEEAESISQAGALCTWRYASDWAISAGDVNQSEPFHISDKASECHDLARYSDLQSWIDRGYPIEWLLEQHRGIPGLYEFTNREVFGGKMTNGPSTLDLHTHSVARKFRKVMEARHVPLKDLSPDFSSNYFLKNVGGQAETSPRGEVKNEIEAKIIVEDVAALLQDGEIQRHKVTILCFYKGQVQVVKRLLLEAGIDGVICSTVDKYLGGDNDFVYVSITGGIKHEARQVNGPTMPFISGFITKINRIIVAITRAKYGCAIYSNFWEMSNTEVHNLKPWSILVNLIVDAFQRNCMLNAYEKEGSPFQRDTFYTQQNLMYAHLRIHARGPSKVESERALVAYCGRNSGTAAAQASFADRLRVMAHKNKLAKARRQLQDLESSGKDRPHDKSKGKSVEKVVYDFEIDPELDEDMDYQMYDKDIDKYLDQYQEEEEEDNTPPVLPGPSTLRPTPPTRDPVIESLSKNMDSTVVQGGSKSQKGTGTGYSRTSVPRFDRG